MVEFLTFAQYGLAPICMAETGGDQTDNEATPPPYPTDPSYGRGGRDGNHPAPSEGNIQPQDPQAPQEGVEGDVSDENTEGEADTQPEEAVEDDSETGDAESILNEPYPELVTETQQPEPIPPEPTEPDGPGFLPGLLIGALAGVLMGAGVAWLLSSVRRAKKHTDKAGKGTLQVVTLQGVGARENQQDSLAASDPNLYAEQGVLLCVADGMGGLKNGGMVSRTAVSTVMSKFATLDKTDPDRMIAALVQSATSAVNMVLSPDYGSGGTTLLLGYVKDGLFSYAAVGDSRICLYRDEKLIHLNRPHVFEDELLLRYINGEISYDSARTYEKRGALTSYLGMGKLKYADIPSYHIPIRSGDRFILMSDGIFNTLSDEEIAAVIQNSPRSIPAMLNKEIERKHTRFQDNYSAVVLAVD